MSILGRTFLLLATLLLVAAARPAAAQIPDEFTNLKILPKDISKRELVGIMRNFAGALGKRCNYCHVGEDNGSLEGMDFASDEKESKRVARIMMQMVSEINDNQLAKLEDEDVIRVRCITCHRGVTEPQTIDDIVLEAAEEDGIDAALAKYREMREEYYGSGSYDFSSGPLYHVAETLARERNDVAGAITVTNMSIELNPNEANTYLLLAQLQQSAGDNAAAIAAAEKALELDPENRWGKGLLERLKGSQ